MKVSIYELKTKAIKRLHARMAREVVVELSSRRKVIITKWGTRGTGYIELPETQLSERDSEENILAQQLMGQ